MVKIEAIIRRIFKWTKWSWDLSKNNNSSTCPLSRCYLHKVLSTYLSSVFLFLPKKDYERERRRQLWNTFYESMILLMPKQCRKLILQCRYNTINCWLIASKQIGNRTVYSNTYTNTYRYFVNSWFYPRDNTKVFKIRYYQCSKLH